MEESISGQFILEGFVDEDDQVIHSLIVTQLREVQCHIRQHPFHDLKKISHEKKLENTYIVICDIEKSGRPVQVQIDDFQLRVFSQILPHFQFFVGLISQSDHIFWS